MLSRVQILEKVGKLKRKEVLIPEWGGSVLVREFTGAERDSIESLLLKAQKSNSFMGVRVETVILAAINEDGTPIFTKKDWNSVSELSSQALDALFNEVFNLSGMKTDEAGEPKEGNLPIIPVELPGSE